MIRVNLQQTTGTTERVYDADRWTTEQNQHGATALFVWNDERLIAQFQPGQWTSVDDVSATFGEVPGTTR